jgi:hypothetical protein
MSSIDETEADQLTWRIAKVAHTRREYNEAVERYNAQVAAAHKILAAYARDYDGTIADAQDFCRKVAATRVDYEDPRPQRQADVRDLGQTWRSTADDLENLTTGVPECPKAWPVNEVAEDVLRDLPMEVGRP